MQELEPIPVIEQVEALSIYHQLRKIGVFSQLSEHDADCFGLVDLIHIPTGGSISQEAGTPRNFCGIIEGSLRGLKQEEGTVNPYVLHYTAGESFGEVPMLSGMVSTYRIVFHAISDTTMVRFDEQGFWRIMSTCPIVRQGVLANMGQRLQTYQAVTLHREKLISLGTLAAGLMHELNNPGTAARRAATQLRDNLVRLQHISLRYCEVPLQPDQIECMKELQQRALAGERPTALSSIDQSDAEEALAEWLGESGVQDGWRMAPTLAAIGFSSVELECTKHAFEGNTFSDALDWLVSLVSSMQLVGTIEESITRVSELVTAVKKFSYNETGSQMHEVDIHDGLRSTITILAHKLRPKDLKVDKQFSQGLPLIHSCGSGLTQVWTNLLDNAVDASPERGTIHIRTWVEGEYVCVGIADEGAGIAEEHRNQIFDPFFTTKAVGVGTGLGLDIAHRIVVGSYGGEIGFTSEPGKTEFIVRVPIAK